MLCLATLVAATGGCLFGYDTGIVSAVLLYIKFDYGLLDWSVELFVSCTAASAIAGALLSGVLNRLLGRKPVMLISSITFVVGASLMAFAPMGSGPIDVAGYWTLVAGRIVVGRFGSNGVWWMQSRFFVSKMYCPINVIVFVNESLP